MARKLIFRSNEEWDEIIRQCKSSGLSDRQWCEEHGIPASTYYNRLKKFWKTMPVQDLPTKAKQQCREIHSVVPLTILDAPYEGSEAGHQDVSARIHMGGVTIELYNHTGHELVENILQMAVRLC